MFFPKRYVLKFVAGVIGKLGKGPHSSPVNETDFYTDKPLGVIPSVYTFLFKTSDGVIGADIRSLVDYTADTLTNPYTSSEVTSEDQHRYSRHVHLLKKFGWFTSHILPLNDRSSEQLLAPSLPESFTQAAGPNLKQITVNTFSVLAQYHYVDYNWFCNLTVADLKQLYYLLYQLWTDRLDLQPEQKLKIVPSLSGDLNLFRNYRSVKLYTDDMEDVLRMELLSILKRLLSSPDQTARKEGGLYFLLGLVIVSPGAAAAYPTLHNAVIY